MRGKPRYKCKGFGCNYTRPTLSRTPLVKGVEAIKLYLEGVGFCGIEWLTGIPHTMVILWVKNLAGEIERLRPELEETIRTVELDERWHFIHKKLKSAEFGLQGTEKASGLSASS